MIDQLVQIADNVRGVGVVELPIGLLTTVVREPRARCVNCDQRRVLYRIRVSSTVNHDDTSARCAPCWGIR